LADLIEHMEIEPVFDLDLFAGIRDALPPIRVETAVA
jgi:hypothetical protein